MRSKILGSSDPWSHTDNVFAARFARPFYHLLTQSGEGSPSSRTLPDRGDELVVVRFPGGSYFDA
jgi:hypothetical protein